MSDPFLGEIRMVGFSFAPIGWALCAGQMMPVNQNQALFALLGTNFGGNGQTTFGLPNLCGRSPVGVGQGPGLTMIDLGEAAGVEAVTLTTSQMPIHTHSLQPFQVGGTVNVSIPANSSSTSGNTGTPGPTTVLGPATASGRAADVYTTTAANTNLLPFSTTFNSNVTPPANAIGNAGGSQPVEIRNPYLGVNMIIALQGIYPTRG